MTGVLAWWHHILCAVEWGWGEGQPWGGSKGEGGGSDMSAGLLLQ